MAVKISGNKKVGGSTGVRQNLPQNSEGISSFTRSLAGNAIDAWGKVEETRRTAEVSDMALKWNEAMSAENVRLTQREGLEAVDSAREFNIKSEEWIGQQDFKDSKSQKAFIDKIKVNESQYTVGLDKHDITQAFSAKQEALLTENGVSLENIATALLTGDDISAALFAKENLKTLKDRFPGSSEETINQIAEEQIAKTASPIFTQKIKNGQVTESYVAMNKLFEAKIVDENTYETFKASNSEAYAEDKGNKITSSIFAERDVYTQGEWLKLLGEDISNYPESAMNELTTFKMNINDVSSLAGSKLDNYNYGSDTFYGESLNEKIKANANKKYTKIDKEVKEVTKNAIDGVNTDLTNLIYQREYNSGNLEEVAKINAEIEAKTKVLAESYGEYELANKIKELDSKQAVSVDGEFEQVYFGILSGVMDNRTIIENPNLDWKEKNALTSTYNKFKVDNMTDRYAAITDKMLLDMTGKDDIDDLDPSSKIAFEFAVKTLVSELSNKSIAEMSNDDIDRLLRESVSVGWTQLDAKQLKTAKRAALKPTSRLVEDAREIGQIYSWENLLKRF